MRAAHLFTTFIFLILFAVPTFAHTQTAKKAAKPANSVDKNSYSTGPYSRMHMLLQKTIFYIDVLTLDVKIDVPTQVRLKKIWLGHRYSEKLANETAQILYGSEHVEVDMHFVRNVGFDRFINETLASAKCARKANAIDDAEYNQIRTNARQWYAPISALGIKSGDTLSYDIEQSKMHTVLQNKDGTILVDQTDAGREPGLSVLGGFFAPCSDYRKPLFQSLK